MISNKYGPKDNVLRHPEADASVNRDRPERNVGEREIAPEQTEQAGGLELEQAKGAGIPRESQAPPPTPMPKDGWRMWATSGEGYRIYWNNEPWPMKPKQSHSECEAYMERLRIRYPNEAPAVMLGRSQDRQRGGPWRWSLPNGETGVVHMGRLNDAKQVLRHERQCKRLPTGIEWEIVQDG